MWQAAIKNLDVPQVRLHDARHTCATLMHLQGVPIALAAAWLGHADVSFTLRTYVHAQPEALEMATRSFAPPTTSASVGCQGNSRPSRWSPEALHPGVELRRCRWSWWTSSGQGERREAGDFGQRGLTSSLRLPHGDVRSGAWRVARCVVLGEFGSASPSGGTRGSRDGLAD